MERCQTIHFSIKITCIADKKLKKKKEKNTQMFTLILSTLIKISDTYKLSNEKMFEAFVNIFTDKYLQGINSNERKLRNYTKEINLKSDFFLFY